MRDSGGGLVVEDDELTPGYIADVVLPLLLDRDRLREMSAAAATFGRRDADERLADLVLEAAASRERVT